MAEKVEKRSSYLKTEISTTLPVRGPAGVPAKSPKDPHVGGLGRHAPWVSIWSTNSCKQLQGAWQPGMLPLTPEIDVRLVARLPGHVRHIMHHWCCSGRTQRKPDSAFRCWGSTALVFVKAFCFRLVGLFCGCSSWWEQSKFLLALSKERPFWV